jgi:uncharacterized protein YndB with AHSA1/START domain
MRDSIIIERDFNAPIEAVFGALVDPEILVKWHHAGDGWITPYAEVDPVIGGKLKIAYAGPDGKVVFDLVATISEISPPHKLTYIMGAVGGVGDDHRHVTYTLSETDKDKTHMHLEFDIEHVNDRELQRQGWSQHYDNLTVILPVIK